VVGHQGYYPRFGFSPVLARKFISPFATDAFMALELAPGAMEGKSGTVTYPPAFGLMTPDTIFKSDDRSPGGLAGVFEVTSEKGEESHSRKTTPTTRRLNPQRSGHCQAITLSVQSCKEKRVTIPP
jgi:hypothetical protein